jgi:putative endonuclease
LVDRETAMVSLQQMREELAPAVYILANRYRGTIYVGVTGALWNRVASHKDHAFDGFTKDYGVTRLVWYEHHQTMENAIRREKRLKKWNRDWKIRLIEKMNRDWVDLHDAIDPIGTLVPEKEAGSPPARG